MTQNLKQKAVALLSLVVVFGLSTTSAEASKLRKISNTQLHVGTGLGSMYGGFGLPLNFGFRFRAAKGSRVLIGGDTGVTIGWGFALPLMASVTYEVNNSRKDDVRPYAGASLGPVFSFMGGYYYGAGVSLAMLLRPGINIRLSDNLDLNTEVPFGSVGNAFYMAPQANLVINL
ncbi:MAG: hypothetical protein KDD51_06850 [Bdellovibrionales bacterium]|nr:hypothetical protein [Bdellovibrionales bacterium]